MSPWQHLKLELALAAPYLERPGGACPDWCTTGPHPWTTPAMWPDDWTRVHRQEFGDAAGVIVVVEQYENLRADHEQADRAHVVMTGRVDDGMDGVAAAHLAGALVSAGHLVDRVNGDLS
ncbi:MAG TPA: hypothetical protein VGP26_24705 [Actinophytocola sp.]|nr:hypothetical protein [Actinophytocola sp.]